MSQELFPPQTRTPVKLTHLLIAAVIAERLGEHEVTILGYNTSFAMPTIWFCFDVGERKFAIWTTTGRLYTVDEHGAVADDPITIEDL